MTVEADVAAAPLPSMMSFVTSASGGVPAGLLMTGARPAVALTEGNSVWLMVVPSWLEVWGDLCVENASTATAARITASEMMPTGFLKNPLKFMRGS